MTENKLFNKGTVIGIIFGMLFGICFAIPILGRDFSVTGVTIIEDELWTLNDDDTLHPNNESWNVSIGRNGTTTYKLDVNGTLRINETSYFAGNVGISFLPQPSVRLFINMSNPDLARGITLSGIYEGSFSLNGMVNQVQFRPSLSGRSYNGMFFGSVVAGDNDIRTVNAFTAPMIILDFNANLTDLIMYRAGVVGNDVDSYVENVKALFYEPRLVNGIWENQIGVHINCLDEANNNTEVLLGDDQAEGNWSIYSSCAYPSYFAGAINTTIINATTVNMENMSVNNITEYNSYGINILDNLTVDNDTNITGNLRFGNIHYAEAWNYSSGGWTFVIPAVNIYLNLSNLTVGGINGFTFTTDDEEDGGSYFTCVIPGLYKVDASLSFAAVVSGGQYGIAVVKNYDVELNRNLYSRRAGTGTTGNVGVTGFIRLVNGDIVNMQIEQEVAPTKDITIYTANFNLIRIGD